MISFVTDDDKKGEEEDEGKKRRLYIIRGREKRGILNN